jgi:hypothetical protein
VRAERVGQGNDGMETRSSCFVPTDRTNFRLSPFDFRLLPAPIPLPEIRLPHLCRFPNFGKSGYSTKHQAQSTDSPSYT